MRVEFEDNNPELSGFQDATVQEIRTEASTDPEQKALRTFVETGWPNDKASVSVFIHPYWSVRHDLTIHNGLLFLVKYIHLAFAMLLFVCKSA